MRAAGKRLGKNKEAMKMCVKPALSPSLTQKWSLHLRGDSTLKIPGILILDIEETYCKGSGENELSPGPWILGHSMGQRND